MEIITSANHDEATGYRYGVISPHAINQDALDDVYSRGTDPHWENAVSEIRVSVGDFAGQAPFKISEDLQEQIADLIIDDFSDNYIGNDDGQCDYSDKEYTLHVSGDNFGIFVMKSPYYTYCRGCSPCAPGAGDLDAPMDVTIYETGEHESDGYPALCLGHDWFENNKAPYRVFRVSDDTEVLPE